MGSRALSHQENEDKFSKKEGRVAKLFDTVVIGCGVIGLSTGVRLLQAGRSVCIVTAEPPESTTSNLAAAVWYPTKFNQQDGVLEWAKRTADVFSDLTEEPDSGVIMRDTTMLLRSPGEMPWWAEAIGKVNRTPSLEPPYVDGYDFVVPLVEMPVYLPWLLDRFISLGGEVEKHRISSLSEAASYAASVVNCSGLGARELCGDTQVVPGRGQVVRVENPGLTLSLRDEGHPQGKTYIHPRNWDCILGGTFDLGVWDKTPDMATAEAILKRCSELVPELAGAEVLEHHVGLRPVRKTGIRLEVDPVRHGGAHVVHNYGHGGAGVTLAWGCAEQAATLVEQEG